MAEDNIENQEVFDVEETINKSEQFIEDNKEKILYVLLGICAVIAVFMYYTRVIMPEQELAAAEDMFVAERNFEKDSLDLALNGYADDGFLYIIDEYGSTKSGNLANYYAGLCYLKLGEFEEAIDYLKAYNGEDLMTASLAIGAIGDANMELGDKEEAAEYYEKAAQTKSNDFTTPIFLLKAGEVYESLGDYEKAIEIYESIKEDYSKSVEASKVTKYITRAKANS